MKKILSIFFLAALFALLSCSKESIEPIEEPALEIPDTRVSIDDAIRAVDNFLEFLDSERTRSGRPKRTVSGHYLLGENSATRSGDASQQSDGIFYLINFADDEGFAIVGADTRLPTDIFAIADSGNIDPEEGVDNPGLSLFLAALGDLGGPDTGIGGGGGGGIGFIPDLPELDDQGRPIPVIEYEFTDWKNKVYPCLRSGTKWHQGAPYNSYCPIKDGKNCLVGCVAVAVAQLMACWEYPYNYEGIILNWGLIKIDEDIEKTPTGNTIPVLMRVLGNSNLLDMDYGLKGSSADSKKVPKVMKALGYSSPGGRKHYDPERVNNELIDGYPLIASGKSHKKSVFGINTYSGGHAWVIEELLVRSRTKYTYVNGSLFKREIIQSELVYCNWGWGDYRDGYYYHKVFNANKITGGPADVTRSGEDNNYAYKLRTYTGIRR
ncbi:MAG: C10 family peptidase [Rikenellaceae bacterium]|nr:C10 family peptidase [Rikenellaceae bacterium]